MPLHVFKNYLKYFRYRWSELGADKKEYLKINALNLMREVGILLSIPF